MQFHSKFIQGNQSELAPPIEQHSVLMFLKLFTFCSGQVFKTIYYTRFIQFEIVS